MVNKKFLMFLLFWMINFMAGDAQPTKVDQAPLHDAFLPATINNLVLEAAPAVPPTIILEKVPPTPDTKAIWISGYWEWFANKNDFIWVSGMWRVPPPNRFWIPGSWVPTEEGWVRVRGFWSDVPLERLKYIPIPPPDNLEETPPKASGEDYFWMRGYWSYSDASKTYQWIDGQWAEFDPNWIFVPAYYVWRPEGYVFVSPYWDWPVENVGTPYASVYIYPEDRPNFVYSPIFIVEPEEYISSYFISYPNYLFFFHHHFHFHRPFWDRFDGVPNWWLWSHWWTFNPHSHWGLWWWWTHPNYPQPHWLTKKMSDRINPPPKKVLDRAKNAPTPLFVTPQGVVTNNQLLDAYKNVDKREKKPKDKFTPVVPRNDNLIKQVKSEADKTVRAPKDKLKPEGPKLTEEDLRRAPVTSGPVPEFVREGRKARKNKEIKPLQVPSKPAAAVKEMPQDDGKGKPVQTPPKVVQPPKVTPPQPATPSEGPILTPVEPKTPKVTVPPASQLEKPRRAIVPSLPPQQGPVITPQTNEPKVDRSSKQPVITPPPLPPPPKPPVVTPTPTTPLPSTKGLVVPPPTVQPKVAPPPKIEKPVVPVLPPTPTPVSPSAPPTPVVQPRVVVPPTPPPAPMPVVQPKVVVPPKPLPVPPPAPVPMPVPVPQAPIAPALPPTPAVAQPPAAKPPGGPRIDRKGKDDRLQV